MGLVSSVNHANHTGFGVNIVVELRANLQGNVSSIVCILFFVEDASNEIETGGKNFNST
jgi:hypothetical protein